MVHEIFTLPIRNWNFYLCGSANACTHFYSTYKELKLAIQYALFDKDLYNFYSTYKELKQATYEEEVKSIYEIFTLPIRNWNDESKALPLKKDANFYSTYKELKQAGAQYRERCIIDFYSTYKELKPPWTVPLFPLPEAIFTLPIRNWNISASVKEKSNIRFLLYL